MKPGKIRPKAICVFRNHDRILVFEAYDAVKAETFYRPLGGKIEFGEYGHETVAREIREELGEAICNVHYLGTLESIFVYNGENGHEIMLIYDGEFVDETVYVRNAMEAHEDRESFKVVWKDLDDFRAGDAPLYPDGLLALLDEEG